MMQCFCDKAMNGRTRLCLDEDDYSWVIASILWASKDVHLLRGELLGRQHFPLGEGSVTVHVHPHESALDLGRGGKYVKKNKAAKLQYNFYLTKPTVNNYWLLRPHGTSA